MTGVDLAQAHWNWVADLFTEIIQDNPDLVFGKNTLGYLYRTAMDHGYKHGAEDALKPQFRVCDSDGCQGEIVEKIGPGAFAKIPDDATEPSGKWIGEYIKRHREQITPGDPRDYWEGEFPGPTLETVMGEK